jgi:hypothetical protein
LLPKILQQQLGLLHAAGLGLFLGVAHSPRFFRLSTVAPPAILICVWLLSAEGRAKQVARAVLCAIAGAFAVILPINRQREWHGTVNLPIGRAAFVDAAMYREIAWMAKERRPGDGFFNDPALELYVGMENPTGWEYATDSESSQPGQLAVLVGELQQRPPRFVVLRPQSPTLPVHKDDLAPFQEFVHKDYRLAASFEINKSRQYVEEIWEFK